jgi:hypothetical protein
MVSIRTVFIVSCFILSSSFQPKKFDYVFRISSSQNSDNLPTKFKVEIINYENSTIHLNNLVFNFYMDGGGFWATTDRVRFLDKALVLKSKAHFRRTISIDSLSFVSFNNNQITSVSDIKTK